MWGSPNQYRGPRPPQYPQHKQWDPRSSHDGWNEDKNQVHRNNLQHNGYVPRQHQSMHSHKNDSNRFRNNPRYPIPPDDYSHSLEKQYHNPNYNAPSETKEQSVNVMVDSLLKSCREDVNSSTPVAHPHAPPMIPHHRPYMPESGHSRNISYNMQQGNQFNHPPPMIETLPMNHGEMNETNFAHTNQDQSWREGYGGLQQNYQKLPNKSANDNYQSHESKTKSEETNNQRQMDEKWVLDWIVKKNIMMRKKTDSAKQQYKSLRVPEIRALLQEAYSLVRQLQDHTDCLSKNISKNEDWDREYHKTLQIKERLNNIQKDLNPDAISNLLRKLKIIKKKRVRDQQRKKEAFENKEEATRKRELRNFMIDEWRSNILQKDLEVKMEKEVKKSADKTLAEVRKKIQEANNGVEVLQGLQKLRELRKDAAQRKGLHTSKDLDIAFEENVTEQKSILEKQLAIYEIEKRTLEVMLETEQEENKEKENELHKQRLFVKQQEIEAVTKKWLFGPNKPLRADNPLHSFKKFYSGADQSLEMFLHTRHDWDMFLVQEETPGGSRIPPGWVVPVEPSDQIWASALKINQT